MAGRWYDPGDSLVTSLDSDISWRTRRAFTFVESLHIIGPLAPIDLVMLWHVTEPGTVLFPHVRHLRLDDSPGSGLDGNYARITPKQKEIVQKSVLDDSLSLFNQPDVCVCGQQSFKQIPSLLDRVRTITTHGIELLTVIENCRSVKPLEGRSCRVFNRVYEGLGYPLTSLVGNIIPHGETLLEERVEREVPFEILCLVGLYDWDQPALEDRDPVSKELRSTHPDVVVKLFERDDIDQCDPCTECGRFHGVS